MDSDVSSDEAIQGELKSDRKANVRDRKISLRTKLAFSSGAFQEGVVTAGGITTLLFYNQILGVDPKLCGWAFLIASIVDAVTDPLVGMLSDRFNSRWGRRHPFMFVSAFPLALAFYFLYQPLGGLSETGYFVWLVTSLIIMRLAYTFYNIPHDALGAEMTDNYDERTSLFGFNYMVHTGASIGLSMLLYWVLFASTPEYSVGLLNESRYPWLAGIGAVIIFTAIMVCTFGTRDQIAYLHKVASTRQTPREYFGNLMQLVINPSYLAVCFSWLCLAAAIGILQMVSTYAYLFVYELSTEELSIAGLAKIPGVLVGLPLTILLTRFLDKKYTFIVAAVVSAMIIAVPHFLRMAEIFPEHESLWYLPILFGPMFIGFMILPVSYIVVDSQLVDICDDHELRTGVRAEGVVFSIRTFAMKSTQGLGGLIGGFGLSYINFPDNAEVGQLAPEVIDGLLFMNGPVYLFVTGLGALFMLMYQLDKKRHKAILAVLEERRAAKASD